MSKKINALRNIIHVAFSQGVALFSGIITGLLLPKVLPLHDYGMLKIFTLYVAYTALLHFGFTDGVLLRFAGSNYEDLNKKEQRTYSRFLIFTQILFGGLLAGASFFVQNADYRFILVMLGIDMVALNLTAYYQYLSQATQRFREFSLKNFTFSVAKAALVLILWILEKTVMGEISYQLYLILLVTLDILMMIWYFIIYRDVIFGERLPLKVCKKNITDIFRTGFVMTVAYQVSHLVKMLDRQFVSVLYPSETYAVYAFAYHLITLISTMVASLAIVLFPMLKKTGKESIEKNYNTILSGVCAIIGAALVLYYPLVTFIGWFLPEYVPSVTYLKIVLPNILFTGAISVVMFTFVKILNENLRFFQNSLLILGLGFVMDYLAQMLFHSPAAISYASLTTMAIWFVLEGHHLKKILNLSYFKEFTYVLCVTAGFLILVNLVPQMLLGMICYLAFFALVTSAFFPKIPKQALSFIRKK